MITDINNIELNVGDKVVFAFAVSGFLHKGEIVKFTKEGVSIKHRVVDYSKYNKNTKSYDSFRDSITNLRGLTGRIMKLG